MSPLEVKNVKISTIQPSEKTHHPAALYATLLDLGALDVYIPLIFFYRPNEDQTVPGDLINILKESLSKVLVPYFPLAGRWVRTYDKRLRELQCTDEGVPFVEAYVDGELNALLNNGDFQQEPRLASFELLGLDPEAVNQECDIPMPALFIQATRFKCGGVALNVTFNHLTCDGQALVSFMTAWSQIAKHGETSIVPTHDRSLIYSREAFGELVSAAFGQPPKEDDSDSKNFESNGVISSSETEIINPRDVASAAPEIETQQNIGLLRSSELLRVDPADVYKLPVVGAFKSKVLHVKRETIENLKREAEKEKLDVTTLDLITAHIWRSLYNLPETKRKASGAAMSTFVEGRRRFHDPHLPDHYFGSVIVLANTPPVPFARMSSYSHPFAASIVHNAVQALNPSTWKDSMLDTVKVLQSFNQLDYTQVHMTSWHRFPIYDISFDSCFGNPIFACYNISSKYLPLGIVVVLPPPPKHSDEIIATVQLLMDKSNGTAEALYSDPEFLSFFHSSNITF